MDKVAGEIIMKEYYYYEEDNVVVELINDNIIKIVKPGKTDLFGLLYSFFYRGRAIKWNLKDAEKVVLENKKQLKLWLRLRRYR